MADLARGGHRAWAQTRLPSAAPGAPSRPLPPPRAPPPHPQCIGRANSVEGPQPGGEHIDVEYKEGLVDGEVMVKVAEFLKRYVQEPLPFAMRDKLLSKGERQPEKHFFMRVRVCVCVRLRLCIFVPAH